VSNQLLAFLGPSLPARTAEQLVRCRVLPPARAGDVWRALTLRPRVIALIDGVFDSQPSVWHREILDALAAGVAVFGAASMGALRAAELQSFGMVGVGSIFVAYRDKKLIDDGEVALLHADQEHAFRPLTVPLVNVRHQVGRAREAGALAARDARSLLVAAEALFYQERTWPQLLSSSGLSVRARQRFEAMPFEDLKAQDARACLVAASAFLKTGMSPPPLARPIPPSHARRRRVAGVLARGDADAGLRRSLLAAFARGLGLQARADPRLQAALIGSGLDAERAERLARDVALERLALAWGSRLVNDGPDAAEAAVDEAVLRRATDRRKG
jgi:hypothetical protein